MEQLGGYDDLDEIKPLTAEEKQKILIEWNNTAAEYPKDKCIHELFQEQVRKTPGEVAVVFADQTLTYRELDERSNKSAAYLQKQGVKPDSLVGMCLERSLELIVGILGILKAGGAYLPIDPDYPQERIDYILADGNARVLLTTAKLQVKVKTDLFSASEPPFSTLTSTSTCKVSPANLAYVIYTSGSTGRPKGVMVVHYSVNRLVLNTNYLQISGEDTFLQYAPISFDAATLEIWGPLLNGAKLSMAPTGRLSLTDLKDFIEKQKVTTAWLTAPLFQSMVEEKINFFKSIKTILAGGDVLPAHAVKKLSKKYGQLQIINGYGPTENTTFTCCYRVNRKKLPGYQKIPIGVPISNTACFILDEQLKPVPTGVYGELYTGGDGLARGYLNQPELTNDKFLIINYKLKTEEARQLHELTQIKPTSNQKLLRGVQGGGFLEKSPPGRRRLYRTGDLTRWLPDGNIEFSGRKDQQVKIRGFRIELGEIETVLAEHPQIQEAVVIAKNVNNNPQLIAYYVTHDKDKILATSQIRSYLQDKLPEYMIPLGFVSLESIPLTPNGKVDRKTLRQQEVELQSSREYAAPKTKEEITFCKIWEQLFGFKPIGTRDNFFNLGGNSLLAARLKIRVKESFGKVISIPDIYENPTIETLTDKMSRLNREESQFPLIKKIARKSHIPLSIQQEQVWYLCTMAPGNRAYNFQFTLRFQGKFNKRLFESCLTDIIRRHEIFWTTFPNIQGKPVQVIHEPWEVKIPVVDLRGIPGIEERERQLEELIQQELNIIFDFTKLPLIGFKVFLLEEEEFLFLQIEHHLIHDGWSNAIFLQEFKVLYEAYQKDESSPLPDLTVQFSDYATWQRKWFDGDFSEKQLDYWLKKIKEFPNILELPTDKPRPKMQRYNGDLIRRYLPGDLYQALRMFCRERETTLFVTLFSAFAILLHFYTDQQDMLIGTGMVNRRLKETTHLIGMIVNTIVLPMRLCREQLFIDLLKRVQELVLQAHENQETPVEKIVERLAYERDLSRNPLFQVLFSFHDSPVPNMEFTDLRGEYRVIHNKTAKTDINVVCLPRAEQRIGMEKTDEEEKLEILWEYNTDIFKKETMERMINHYMKILKDILNKYKKRISDIEIIDENEKKKILYDFNNTKAEYPKDKCIHELFEEQVKKSPKKVALVFEDQALTYRELDEKSTALARVLQKYGVTTDRPVGICLERSLEMIVGIMGILKAGAGYLPIEPDYPPARTRYMLGDSNVRIFVTTAKLQVKIKAEVERTLGQSPVQPLQLINIETAFTSVFEPSLPTLTSACQVNPVNLAYVIYTSGSTGKPKGVMVKHYSVTRLVLNTNYLQISGNDIFLQYAPISFDASTLEIWGPFLNGAQLSVAPAGRLSLADLDNFVEKYQVTTAWLTAPLFQTMEEERFGFFRTLKTVLAGGDVLSFAAVKKLAERYRNLQIINGYGPTENTTFTCCYRVNRKMLSGYQKVPIGVPIANTTIYILDKSQKPVPLGVYGELYTGGDGLARGYLNHPEMTAEKFINYKSQITNDMSYRSYRSYISKRIYKTGDLARWLPDSNIEFLGRIDNQVKVRGFRIECGEIETALAEHPRVQEAVVIAGSVNNSIQLVAYYVAADKNKVLEVSEIRNYLQKTLPEYMIPAAFVSLEEIPLTPNGKADRKALLKHEVALESSQVYLAPRTKVEKQLARIWEEVLGAARVGVYDNFFELGGHSLLATQIISRINQELGVDVPLSKLFEAPNLESLSIVIAESDPYQFVPPGSSQRPGKLPLSYAQERLWFLAQLGYSEQYHVPKIMKIKGNLDVEALQKSINFIALRHESLRTWFKTVDGTAIQVIEEAAAIQIEQIDLSGLNKDLQQQDCQTIIREFIQRPFKLEKAPLIRVVLVKLETTTHILGMCLHHIIVDGWSLGILTREISQTYAAYKKEKEPGLEELKIQYADYSLWQREVLTEERLDKELKYWEKYLTGYENMDLPGDYPRPRQISGKGGHVKFRLQRQEVNPLTKLGQEKQMTLFTVFVASVYILLRRYSRQQDICLGMPVANRNHREIENLVGFFVNTLVIRINTGEQGNITVGQLLRKVKEEIVAAQDRQNVPFEKVVETLQPTRDLSRTPIFQVLVNYINTGTEEMQLGECQLQEVDFDYKISKFDLAFTFTQQEDKDIKVNLTYNQDLYGEESIRRMGGHLLKIMTNLVEETGKTVDEIDLLSEEEKQKLVIEWNNTAVEYPGDQCIHELFERQVDRTPDNIAAAGPSKVKHRTYMTYMTYISYNELNKKSNQLAQLLMSKSVQPDTVVGIMAERSLELIIGILAILKAGGAYLPIDPEYPPARIRYILEDSNAGVLLTTPKIQVKVKTEVEGNPGQLPGQPLQLINMETDLTPVFEPPLSTLTSTCQVTPADLAYVIYTSGSTGKPKGVMVEHQNILNTLYALQSRYPVNRDDTYLLKTNYVFDVSLTELFAWFLDAGRLVILKPGQEKDPQAILKVLSERKITHINFVPSMLISFLDLVSESDLKVIKYLKYVMVAGEAFPGKLARKSQKKFSQAVKIENIYGPTEISIYATWFSVNDIKESAPQVPIGNPLYNVQAYILSQEGAFQPIGVPGELHIGGAGLARGYLNQPELTAEKFFLAHSSWLIADGKAMKGVVQLPVNYQLSAFSCIYRTGDLTRWLADGNIEFLGRMDHQVKIRGFRIECEEIETVLAEHPNVQDAVVIARTINNTTQLAAYYVKIDKDKTLEASETRSYLQGKLPEYMIPVVFVALETIPLMPNGKVDRKALLQIEAEPGSSRAYVAPRTGTEKQLTRIWEDVLGKAQIGIHDNFFELGGHSLLATQIISRINRELKVDVPLAKLFEAPRIETLSGVIAESKPYREVPMASIKRPEPLPLSYAQERLWFLVQLGLSERYHLSTIVKLTGKLDPEALQKTINLIAHRHESLRTAFKTLDAAAIQVIEATADIRIELEDLSGIKKEEQERESQTILQDFSQQPFELEKAPLLRVILIKLDGDTHIFGICMHHIISDGWSIGILIKEIRQAYAAHLEGKDPLLEELEIQYADFAVWQREWLQGDTLEKQVSYWKKQLHGVPPLLKLPTDRPRPLTQTFGGDIEYMVLPKTLSSALKSMSQHEGVTLFMTLLAAFKVLLHRYSGEDDIVVGTPIAGRNRAEIEGVIGFFINSLVLRTDLSGHPSFHEVLTRVREVTLGAYAHQDLPFEKLLEELQPERTLSHTPLFQVFFNMLNIGDVEVRLPGLETEPVIPSKIESKFDLTLYVREEEEEIHFRLVYNLDLFERYRMVEMLEQYRYLLEQAAAKPREKIASFSLVTDRTKAVLPNPLQELDSKWEGAVHTQFSRQAQRHPQRPAVQDNHLVFTYSELEAAGNQLANYLLNNGLGLHEMVAIYAHRSASLVWAVLGVLKAGAAFLILDPVYPDSRLLDCLVQAQPRGFIHLEAAGDLPATIKDFLSGSSCCCVVELPQRPASARNPLTNSSIHNPQVKVDADDLAYIAFTSGSTGKPKGILGRHGSLSHFLPWMQKRFGLQETDRYSMLSGLSHDPLHRDIFTPLWLGATICIPDPDDIEAGRIADWMKETKINIAHLTPAMAQLLTQNASDLPSLRYALFVGDVLTRGDVIRLREISHRVTCVNLYGSTETQRAVGYFVVSSAGSEGTPAPDMKEVLPLGCGMKDVQLLVLNNSKQLAGMGELGEIFVRSPHLAIGYLGDETMTHERFIPNPLTNLPGDRIYRSGDLGRYLPNGAVEFAGRKDNQVKIRGFRIELEEIETVLVQLPNIQEAVVIARSVNSITQLVAYYVPGDKDKTLQASETRSYLKNKLPEYMIPAAFVSLEAIPLTPNRKIDRKALQNREIELESCHDYVAPQTETEKQLARIWEEVLGVEKVGIYDNFFELGGHSLLAIQMVTRIRERLGVEFPLKNIFDHATINQLATLFPVLPVTLAENHNLTDVNIPKKNLKPNTSFPLSNGQLMPWLVWIGTKSTWNLYRIYDVKGPIDGFLLEQAFNTLLQRNKSIWTRFTPWRPLQKITPPKHIHLSVIDLRGREPRTREENLEEAMRDAIYTRFDLTSPPLLRLSLIQHEDHQYKLVLVAPHIVIDNTVFHSLFDEFMNLYQAFASGQPLPPKPMDVPLSDYVYWEHKAAKQALQKELDYWQQKLGSASLLYVPDSYLLPPGEPAHPYYVKVDSILLDTLAKFSLQHKVSLQMSLSAVIAIVLHRITSQSDICLSLIVDKRLHHDIKNLVSSMIDMVPIRIQLSKKTSFTDLIAQIKYTTIEAYNHVRGFSAIPLSFLYQPPGQKEKGFVLRVKEHALRFFTWLLTRLWFPKQTYPGIFYAILVGRASRIHPKNKSRRKMHNTTSSVSSTPDGMNVCLNIFPNFYQTSGTSKYICGDVVFSPGKPMKLPKTRQANVLYFTFTNNFEGHPLFMVTGMRLTPSAHQQITTTFGEVLAEVVKNPCSRLEKTTKSKS